MLLFSRVPNVSRRRGRLAIVVAALATGIFCAIAAAGEIVASYHYSDDTLLRIGSYAFAGGKTLNLTVGIGSSAFRRRNDPANVIWTIGDRGPNIGCEELKPIAGVELPACGEVKNGRLFLTPSYAPSIYRVMIQCRLPHYRRDRPEGPPAMSKAMNEGHEDPGSTPPQSAKEKLGSAACAR
jgi:hypothetical protein